MTAIKRHSLDEVRGALFDAAAEKDNNALKREFSKVREWLLNRSIPHPEFAWASHLCGCKLDDSFPKELETAFKAVDALKKCEKWVEVLKALAGEEKKDEGTKPFKIQLVAHEEHLVGSEKFIHQGMNATISCPSPVTLKILRENLAKALNVKIEQVCVGVMGGYNWQQSNELDPNDSQVFKDQKVYMPPKVFIKET